MKFALKDIEPNPFRRIEKYPISAQKVQELRKSIRQTSFWDNLVARRRDGKAQIAYGHHRMAALRAEFKFSHEINLIVRDLDDEMMLRIMARENAVEWQSDAAVEHETVRAVVEAFRLGVIDVSVRSGSATNNARTVEQSDGSVRKYTVGSVARFLEWPEQRVKDALAAIDLIDEEGVPEETFEGVSSTQARAIVREIRALPKAERRPRGERVARDIREAFKRRKGERLVAEMAAGRSGQSVQHPPPSIDKFATRLLDYLDALPDPSRTKQAGKLAMMVKFRESLDEDIRKGLVKSLKQLGNWAIRCSEKLDSPGRQPRQIGDRHEKSEDLRASRS